MSHTFVLPDDLLERAEQLAAFECVPVEEFVVSTLSKQFADLEFLRLRSDRANAESFRAALAQIPDVEPEPYDWL
jgi:hypothetical protein